MAYFSARKRIFKKNENNKRFVDKKVIIEFLLQELEKQIRFKCKALLLLMGSIEFYS